MDNMIRVRHSFKEIHITLCITSFNLNLCYACSTDEEQATDV